MHNLILKTIFLFIFIPEVAFSLTIGSDGKISSESSEKVSENNSNLNDNECWVKDIKKDIKKLSGEKKHWTDLSKKQKDNFNKYVFKAEYDKEGAMVFNTNNVSNKNRYEFFDEFKDNFISEKGIKINLSYKDKGAEGDWNRFGLEGHAQRWQIMERIDFAANRGEEKWYRIFLYIPEETDAFLHQLSFFDFKYIECIGEKTPGPFFNLRSREFVSGLLSPDYFEYPHHNNDIQNAHGELSITYNWDFTKLKGTWLAFLMNVKWAEDGHFHLWINGNLRKSYYGDTIFHYDRVRFKFGPYRNYMDDATNKGEEISDISVRYATVGRGDSCDDVWSGGCEHFISQLNGFSQLNGVEKLVLCQAEMRKDGEPTRSVCKNLQDKIGSIDPIPSIQID